MEHVKQILNDLKNYKSDNIRMTEVLKALEELESKSLCHLCNQSKPYEIQGIVSSIENERGKT